MTNNKTIKLVAFDFGGTLFSTSGMGKFTKEMVDCFIQGVATHSNYSTDLANNVFEQYLEEWEARRARSGEFPEMETILGRNQFTQALRGIKLKPILNALLYHVTSAIESQVGKYLKSYFRKQN